MAKTQNKPEVDLVPEGSVASGDPVTDDGTVASGDPVVDDGTVASGDTAEGAVPEALPPVPVGGNEPGELPPSMR